MTLGFNEINLEEKDHRKIISITFKGTVDKNDYDLLLPQLDGIIREGGSIRIMVELRDFQGWTPKALWEDTKFFIKKGGYIDKIAIVGDKKWEASLAILLKPVSRASIQFFSTDQVDDAKKWIQG